MIHTPTSSSSATSIKAPAPASASSPILQAEDIHKYFRSGSQNLHILRGVNLTLLHGQWLAILGASGCGKSTLLHLLGGLDRPDQGTITHQSQNIFEQPASAVHQYRNKTVGFVFQFYHLLPEFSALENVALAAMIGSSIPGWFKNRKAIRQRAKELLTQVGLEHRLHHRPSKLSGGERQRVAIARALINQPHILLADEPTGNLDADTGKQILDIFQTLHQQGQSIIMVTHDSRIASLADQRLKLHQGQLVDHLPSSPL